jgi:hypothetical protein
MGKKKNVSATVPEIRRLLEVILPRITWDPKNIIAWFMKQRQNKEKARKSHKQKWLANHPI